MYCNFGSFILFFANRSHRTANDSLSEIRLCGMSWRPSTTSDLHTFLRFLLCIQLMWMNMNIEYARATAAARHLYSNLRIDSFPFVILRLRSIFINEIDFLAATTHRIKCGERQQSHKKIIFFPSFFAQKCVCVWPMAAVMNYRMMLFCITFSHS